MDQINQLFDKYQRGQLDDTGVALLHQLLPEKYFQAETSLTSAQLEYTEDLLIERYTAGRLEQAYLSLFENRLKSNPNLLHKASFCIRLYLAQQNRNNINALSQAETESPETQQEQELKDLLREIIETENSLAEMKPRTDPAAGFIEKIREWIKPENWFPDFGLPRGRLVFALASFAILLSTGIYFLFDKPSGMDQPMLSNADTIVHGKQTPKQTLQPESDTLRRTDKPDIAHQLAQVYLPESNFDYSLPRGETPESLIVFAEAAEYYNQKKYDSCRTRLLHILKSRGIKSQDSISEIRYYIGNCYLIQGMKNNSINLVNKSLEYFSGIGPTNIYFNRAMWFRAIALAKTGNFAESIRCCDLLISRDYLMFGKVKTLRDNLIKLR